MFMYDTNKKGHCNREIILRSTEGKTESEMRK